MWHVDGQMIQDKPSKGMRQATSMWKGINLGHRKIVRMTSAGQPLDVAFGGSTYLENYIPPRVVNTNIETLICEMNPSCFQTTSK